MRFLYSLVLVVVLVPLVVFAVQNDELVKVQFLNQSIHFALSLVIGIVYLLGMVSGSSLVGLLKRSLEQMTVRRPAPAAPPEALAK